MTTPTIVTETLEKAREKLSTFELDALKYSEIIILLETLYEDMPLNIRILNLDTILLTLSSGPEALTLLYRKLYSLGYKRSPYLSPYSKENPSGSQLFHRQDYPTVHLAYSSTVCMRKLSHYEMQEVPVYEIECSAEGEYPNDSD